MKASVIKNFLNNQFRRADIFSHIFSGSCAGSKTLFRIAIHFEQNVFKLAVVLN